MKYHDEWKWTPRHKEVVVMTDYDKYRYYGGCPGQTARRLVSRYGDEVNEMVEYYKGYGWLTPREWVKKRERGRRKS